MLRLTLSAVVALSSALSCGTERWPVKTVTDQDAAKIAPAPVMTTIGALISLTPPSAPDFRQDSRWPPTELRVFAVSGVVREIKREADSDLHIVVADDSGKIMILEAVDPACAAGSVFLPQITAVRHTAETLAIGDRVTATGVVFFDKLHGQKGAPNGIELHPLTDLAIR